MPPKNHDPDSASGTTKPSAGAMRSPSEAPPVRPTPSGPVPPTAKRSTVGNWLEERTGFRGALAAALDEPIVGGARWAYVFGSALTIIFSVQALTGVLLMTAYSPSATTAWASVHFISNTLGGGWLVRGLHHFGSQAMVVLLGCHLLQVAIYGAYKRPREMNWFLGLGLLALTLGFSLTGYLLPWDQKGYWATQVATNIAGTQPVVGSALQTLLQGGPSYGNLTLTRFHALHVAVLPASLVAFLVLHLALFRKHGVTPPTTADRARVDAFYPKQVWKDLLFGLLVLGILFALVLRDHGAPLDAPADPASDYPARPEWYFLPLFQLLKYFHGPLEPLGTIGIPAVAGGYLVALPFLDRAKSTALRGRAAVLAPLFGGLVGIAALTLVAMQSDSNDPVFQAARKEADAKAQMAIALAKGGVPPEGPLAMLKRDPTIRAETIFREKCAGCHVLGSMGDAKRASAPVLDGWGTKAWILHMLHDPDGASRFGRTPFAGNMPSMDVKPKEAPPTWKPMSAEAMDAVATFLSGGGPSPEGEAIVRSRCTGCHKYKGEGDDPESVAPELSGYGTAAWIRAQIGNPGSPMTYGTQALDEHLKGHMPRFDSELSPADVDLMASWILGKTKAFPPVP